MVMGKVPESVLIVTVLIQEVKAVLLSINNPNKDQWR
jgi:hypothetical protein